MHVIQEYLWSVGNIGGSGTITLIFYAGGTFITRTLPRKIHGFSVMCRDSGCFQRLPRNAVMGNIVGRFKGRRAGNKATELGKIKLSPFERVKENRRKTKIVLDRRCAEQIPRLPRLGVNQHFSCIYRLFTFALLPVRGYSRSVSRHFQYPLLPLNGTVRMLFKNNRNRVGTSESIFEIRRSIRKLSFWYSN